MSLTVRILVSFALMALAAYFVLLNPVLDRVERQYLEAAEEPMVDVAQIIASILSAQKGSALAVPAQIEVGMKQVKEREFSAQIYNLLKQDVLMDFYVTNAEGRVIYDSGDTAEVGTNFMKHRDVRLTLLGEYGARSSRLDENDSASSLMYVGAPILRGSDIIGVCSVYKPQRSMLTFIQETKRRLVYLGTVTVVCLLFFGYLLSRWISFPLRRLTEYAAAVSAGEHPPAPKMPGYQMRVLAETTEAMREALENRKYVESYVQSLTHEMKSPVAGIRGASELLYEDLPQEKRIRFLDNIQNESVRLQSLVDQLLALSSLENRTDLGAPTRVDLGQLIRRVIDYQESHILEKQVKVDLICEQTYTVRGEEFLLETAISNLLQNAIEFSPKGGRIEISLVGENDRVVLTIRDEGAGIPDFAKERIFDRFYSLPRPDSERKSSGLGLCFVKEAVTLHRGSIQVSTAEGSRGTVARLSLPLTT